MFLSFPQAKQWILSKILHKILSPYPSDGLPFAHDLEKLRKVHGPVLRLMSQGDSPVLSPVGQSGVSYQGLSRPTCITTHTLLKKLYLQVHLFFQTMPRRYKRTTERGRTPIDILGRAARAVHIGSSIRSAAHDFRVDRNTLKRFIVKRDNDPQAVSGYENCKLRNLVFSPEMEEDMAGHIKEMSTQFHGLTKEKCLWFMSSQFRTIWRFVIAGKKQRRLDKLFGYHSKSVSI